MNEFLASRIIRTPILYDPECADRVLRLLSDDEGHLTDAARDLIAGSAACSPYLMRLLSRASEDLPAIFNTSPEKSLASICIEARNLSLDESPEIQSRKLRHLKDRASLIIALCELGGVWETMEAAKELSEFADAVVHAALRMALTELTTKGYAPIDPENPERDSGICIIAMGKHGARELNYSSDIDLIFIYDGSAASLQSNPSKLAADTVKLVCSRLSDQTKNGYVFRTDIRLRPDPGSSAPATSITAAESYYESFGQNWERAAFIKARAIAGDMVLGDEFMTMMKPFVWRKFLDFAAIEDIHSIIRQMQLIPSPGEKEIENRDLKTGQGGIREIEFFAQTQQLVLGGKRPALRARQTLSALSELQHANVIGSETKDILSSCYEKLRMFEHRLQMLRDEQTHKIPRCKDDLLRIANLIGLKTIEDLRRQVVDVTSNVHREFLDFFEDEGSLATEFGSLSFTGIDITEDTLSSLRKMGFERAKDVAEMIKRWHAGNIKATRTKRGRELLTELTPRLLLAFSDSQNPDETFFAFDRFVTRLPTGVQIFSLLANNPAVSGRLISIMSISPDLGQTLARNANLVEMLVEDDWTDADKEISCGKLEENIGMEGSFEGAVNIVRRWGAEQKFNTASMLVMGVIDAQKAASNFSSIAENALRIVLSLAHKEMERLFGTMNGECVIIGLGRLGIGRMTASSDVDLMFVYKAPADAVSDGAKQLGAAEYYLRLMRRVLSAISARGPDPALFEVDMALRPSGRSGPAAVSFSSFAKYYRDGAWTWELMALTKAKILAGDTSLSGEIAHEIDTVLRMPRKNHDLKASVLDMRRRLLENKMPESLWDLRNCLGGITDIEFILQYLLLRELPNGFASSECAPYKVEVLKDLLMKEGVTDNLAISLLNADELYESVTQFLKASHRNGFGQQLAGFELVNRIIELLDVSNFEEAEEKLVNTQELVTKIYQKVLS